MSQHKAKIEWKGGTPDFRLGKYTREHTWGFDGGLNVPASASPSVVSMSERTPSSMRIIHEPPPSPEGWKRSAPERHESGVRRWAAMRRGRCTRQNKSHSSATAMFRERGSAAGVIRRLSLQVTAGR